MTIISVKNTRNLGDFQITVLYMKVKLWYDMDEILTAKGHFYAFRDP